jgi:hypothetical protein
VSVEGVKVVRITDGGNFTTQEFVTVTESTISGTGLFGNNNVVVSYSNVGDLKIVTGALVEAYTVTASQQGATFTTPISIEDESEFGLSVGVGLNNNRGLDLSLDNAVRANPAPASLNIFALDATVNPFTTPTGSESVTFAGGLTDEIHYRDFDNVVVTTHVRNT